MIVVLGALIAGVLAVLAAIHVYWAAGGRWGTTLAIPQKPDGSGERAFTPSTAATLAVARALGVRQGPRFAFEPGEALGRRRDDRAHELHRDGPREPCVEGLPHIPHPALTDEPHQPVLAGDHLSFLLAEHEAGSYLDPALPASLRFHAARSV
jgi:hypothetical protein